jgi:predicted alpha-1,2-mannosidase
MPPSSGYGDPVTITGFFSSFEAGDPQPVNPALQVGTGPKWSPTAKAGVGFTGLKALRYSGTGPARTLLFEVDVPVTGHSELSYVVMPESDAQPTYRSTFIALDIEFDDGSTLTGHSAEQQGDSKTLYLDQWNLVRHRLAEHTGRTARKILLTLDPPPGTEMTGWIDDVRIAERPLEPHEPVDHVRTTRGTHSSGEFSRGNTIPATAVPHGFNFWTPVTDAGATNWLYQYHRHNNTANRPELQAFALSHEPSPWMGDRHTFQVMPTVNDITADRKQRALAFDHENETDRPHHYGVRFDNGITTDLAPTDHGALFRFTFPGDHGKLLFDNTAHRGGLRLNPREGTLTAHTWVRSRLSTGARRMYVYAVFDRPATHGAKIREPFHRTVTGYLRFDAPEVTMRIATSLISLNQARRNLDREIPAGTTFEQVRDAARKQWQDLLGRIELEGATEDQLTTFYSNLYRLFLYPNSAYENTPSGDKHASPVIRRWWPSTRRRTGAKVVDGRIHVNNGFWDTYRTTWPAYALLTPARCAELADGFVQQYREGGWIARWSSPGYANLMTGTSSDVAFADIRLKGVRDFDIHSAYDAALRNATVTPTGQGVGRKGLDRSIFLGYTPNTTAEGLSWALEGCINDFAIANLSDTLLREAATDDPRRTEYRDNARYFRSRAQHYVHHFDPANGFFQGRTPQGDWRHGPGALDPTAWGGDYTETNAWNTAFSVPHDGPGLAALHGGPRRLEAKLDTFFATPETGRNPGAYGGVIHEMTEARDIRLGQYGHSNQPSHHIPYTYNHAGAPSKTQAVVREVLRRCYLGSEIGQGYPGDEDNGEMSAWHIFSALGFYPLQAGSPTYTLGSPLFTKATIHLENGKDIVINAPGNTADTVYVRSLHINGEPHTSTTLAHTALANGATLDFEMSTEPSGWATGDATATAPTPLTPLTGTANSSDRTDLPALSDKTTRTTTIFNSAKPTVDYTVHGTPRPVAVYTLTSSAKNHDPRAWTLEGSDDRRHWTLLDERHGQTFRWRRQTKPFALDRPAAHQYYRLKITDSGPRLAIAQWELLAETR